MRWTSLLLLAALSTLSGCACGGGPAVPWSALETRPYGSEDGAGSSFVLKQDVTLNGQLVPKGKTLSGLPKKRTGTDTGRLDNVEFLIAPEFEFLRGTGNILYGKRWGVPTWVWFDMTGKTPVEHPTPYTIVTRVRYSLNGSHSFDARDRWVGMEPDAKRLTVFDTNGKPSFVFNDVSGSTPRESLKLLRQEGAMIVHHDGYDRIYAGDGRPISPELMHLWSTHIMRSTSMGMAPVIVGNVFGVQTEPKRQRFWLIQENGRTLPKPDDLIGVEPLTCQLYHWTIWSGWLVWWKTPAGERCARVEIEDPANNLAALIASRERAQYTEWTVNWDNSTYVFDDIVRGDQKTYQVLRRRKPSSIQPLASVDAAEKWLNATRATEAEAYAKLMKERDRARVIWEAQERDRRAREESERLAAEQAARDQRLAVAQADFDRAMSLNNKAAARQQLLKLEKDPKRWTVYVSKYGLDPATDNSSGSIGYARAAAGGTEQTVLTAALKRSLPTPAPVFRGKSYAEMSDWEYFWNGPPSTSSGGVVDPGASIDAVHKHLEVTRQRNLDAWMRGAQNWGGPR